MNCICVGGPADGRRVVIPDRESHYYVEELIGDLTIKKPDYASRKVEAIKHRYDRFPLHPVTRAVVLAHSSMTPTEVMESLLEGYRSEAAKR